jgi:oligopeptide transport system substrate-binding protein
MEPNQHYYGGVNPSIAKLRFPVLIGPTAVNTAFNMYKSNESAFVNDIPISLLDAVTGDAELSKDLIKINPSGSVRSLAMNFNAPPFDDVRVRRAFGHAIDRETYSKVIWRETWVPTMQYEPPVVEASSGYQPPVEETPDFNPEKGKQLLADAGFPNGEGLPEIRYYESSEDAADEINRWKAFLDMFKEHLGVEVIHDTSMTTDQIEKKASEEGGLQMEVWWWGNITETAQLMSEVFRTDSPYMKGRFNWSADLPDKGGFTPGKDAKQFDELMAQADVEQDQAKMNDLYRQGEALVLKNAVYVPIANLVPHMLIKPWLQGWKFGWWSSLAPSRIEPSIVVLKH